VNNFHHILHIMHLCLAYTSQYMNVYERLTLYTMNIIYLLKYDCNVGKYICFIKE